MEIQDNVLKEYLKNVYFITGTACSGKTTVSRALAAKHGFAVYDAEQAFDRHRELSNRKDQPASFFSGHTKNMRTGWNKTPESSWPLSLWT